MKECISMTIKEIDRYEEIKKVLDKRRKVKEAAENLGLSERHVLRLCKQVKQEGAKGVVSKKRGAPSNHTLPKELKAKALKLISEKYSDFGPTLAHQYLTEQEKLKISVSSIRRLMIEHGFVRPHETKRQVHHPLRTRRARLGELVQIDGSIHDWFEGRGPKCTLLPFIDDATSAILHLKFVESESTNAYFEATWEYLEKYGRPLAFYSDKHSVFHINRPDALSGSGATQFHRALEELDIQLICAHSPQAKGRVERRNRDLQNRLIKAMRLKNICTTQEANAFIPQFLTDFNKRFAKVPRDPNDAHRPLLKEHDLDLILIHKEERVLSKNLTLQYKNVIYQVLPEKERIPKGAKVTMIETHEEKVVILYRGKPLRFTTSLQEFKAPPVLSGKEVMTEQLTQRKRHHPSPSHPWKRWRPRHLSPRPYAR